MLLLALSPLGSTLTTFLPACPVKGLLDLPCPTCGTTRAAVALSQLDLTGAFVVNPLAALAWIALVGAGLVAGFLAILDRPIREPVWQWSRSVRWLLVLGLVANWVYLVGAGA